MSIKHKFYALRFVASLHIFFGGFLCIIAVIMFFSGLKAPSLLGVPATLLAMWLFIGGLMMMVVGELCYVFLGIEENTRMTNELLQNYPLSETITPAEKENERKISIPSIRGSIFSGWNKKKSISVGILIILVIVFIYTSSLINDNKKDERTSIVNLDEVSENIAMTQSDKDSSKALEGSNKVVSPFTIAKQPAKPAAKVLSEEQKYIQLIDLYDFQAKYYDSLLDGRIPGVEFKLRNNGNRSLKTIEVTVYFKDSNGNTIYEENYIPVNTSSWLEPDKPLKPKYIWQMERGKFYQAKSVPDEWQEGKATAKITSIEFED